MYIRYVSIITSNNIGQYRRYNQPYDDKVRKLVQELDYFGVILGWAQDILTILFF